MNNLIRKGWCASGVAAVAQHRASFNPEKVHECVQTFQPYEDRCLLTAAEFALQRNGKRQRMANTRGRYDCRDRHPRC